MTQRPSQMPQHLNCGSWPAALQLPCEENRQQIQQGGAEAALYVPH